MYGSLKSTAAAMPPRKDDDDDEADDVIGSKSTEAIVESSRHQKNNSRNNDDDVDEGENEKGDGSIFHSVKFYVICQGLIQLSYLILGSYLKSVITSIEKRFGLDSKTAGFMSSGFEIGNLIVILPISYFGRRIHRPRAIAAGVWFMMVGGALLAVPHWMFEPYQPGVHRSGGKALSANISFGDLCSMNGSTNSTGYSRSFSSDVDNSHSSIWRLMFFARMLVGVGAAPVQPYGISYMDDHASRAMAPLYLGVLLAISMVGPALGYILGSYTTLLYVDFDRVDADDVDVAPGDAGWIGAWWLGFLFAAGVMFLVHIPFWFFPKRMKKEPEPTTKSRVDGKMELERTDSKEEKEDDKDDQLLPDDDDPEQRTVSSEDGPAPAASPTTTTTSAAAVTDTKTLIETRSNFLFYLVDFFIAGYRLTSNVVYLVLILAYATLFAISAGFAIFLPKYLQVQFGVSASTANFYIGTVQMPFGILGVVMGGWLMRRWNLSVVKATSLSIVFSFLTLLVGVPLIFIGCETRPIAGVTAPVADPVCVADCHCHPLHYVPVCDGRTGVEYTTPCDAGCSGVKWNETDGKVKILTYENCSCVPFNGSSYSLSSSSFSSSASVSPGRCPSLCPDTFWTAIVLNCALLFICSLVQSPLYTVLLRSVPPMDKSFAIGLQFLIMRTVGWMPAPVYFGATIDSTCVKWAGPVGAKGACKVYDNVSFRQRYLGLITGLQTLGTILMIVLLTFLLRRPSNQK